jgi:hypothetical protein
MYNRSKRIAQEHFLSAPNSTFIPIVANLEPTTANRACELLNVGDQHLVFVLRLLGVGQIRTGFVRRVRGLSVAEARQKLARA